MNKIELKAFEFRLGPEDRERYGLGEEWYRADERRFWDRPMSHVEALEEEASWSLATVIYAHQITASTRSFRAILWFTLRLHGAAVAWKEFDPNGEQVEKREIPPEPDSGGDGEGNAPPPGEPADGPTTSTDESATS